MRKIVGGPNIAGVIVVLGTIYLCYEQHSIWPAIILVIAALTIGVMALVVSGVIKGNGAQGR